MSAFKHICPQFLEENRLCWLRSPLYIVKNGKKETYYFTDEEMNKAPKTKGEVQRNKGLGSLSPQQARDSMFGDVQRMDILKPTQDAMNLLEELMGESAEYRRDFVFNKIDFQEVRE